MWKVLDNPPDNLEERREETIRNIEEILEEGLLDREQRSMLTEELIGTRPSWLSPAPSRTSVILYNIQARRCPQIRIPVLLGRKDTFAMVDSGAVSNFMSEEFVKKNKIPLTRQAKPYRIGNADGTLNRGNKG